jgi:hypothetical protein
MVNGLKTDMVNERLIAGVLQRAQVKPVHLICDCDERVLPPPCKRGRGTIRSLRSKRRMVEGVRASTKLFRRKRCVESDAPSTILLRRMVPRPRYRGGGKNTFSFSRRGFCARVLLHGKKRASQANKGGGGAPKGAGRLPRSRPQALPPACVWSRRAPLLGDALASRRSTAALAKSLAALAQSGPALHGSGQPIRSPGSQLLADRHWPAGRVSEPPADEVTSPIPGTAPARINRPSPVDVP